MGEHLDWEWQAVMDLVTSAQHHQLDYQTLRQVMERAEAISRDFRKASIPQISMVVAMREILEGVTIHTGTSECDVCGQRVAVGELGPMMVDSMHVTACAKCRAK